MSELVGYAGTNFGFGLAVRAVRKEKMAGRDLTLDKMRRIYRQAKAQDVQHQYRGGPNRAA